MCVYLIGEGESGKAEEVTNSKIWRSWHPQHCTITNLSDDGSSSLRPSPQVVETG